MAFLFDKKSNLKENIATEKTISLNLKTKLKKIILWKDLYYLKF